MLHTVIVSLPRVKIGIFFAYLPKDNLEIIKLASVRCVFTILYQEGASCICISSSWREWLNLAQLIGNLRLKDKPHEILSGKELQQMWKGIFPSEIHLEFLRLH